jgi:hypothetical protein
MAIYLAILIIMSLLNIQRLLRFVNLGAVAATAIFAGVGASKVNVCTVLSHYTTSSSTAMTLPTSY